MKLRNKKTGEIKVYTHTMTSYHVPIKGGYEIFTPWKPEEWEELEDVKEPLIKDEKIRKAVRAWAEAVGKSDTMIEFDESANSLWCNRSRIRFDKDELKGLKDWQKYTIAELCGDKQ